MPGQITLRGRWVRPKKNRDGINKLELAYGEHLEAEKRAGRIAEYRFEAVKLRLADKTYYTPDYLVFLPDGAIEFHEVKGFWAEHNRVKSKVVAEQFPWFVFRAFTREAKKRGGGWKMEEF